MLTRKINNFVVKQIHGSGEKDKRPIKGATLLPLLYCVTFIVAKKNSGKTTVIANILRNCVGRDTKVVVFCSTWNNDPTWEAIREFLEKMKVEVIGYTSIFDEHGGNLIKGWLKEQQEAKEAAEEVKEPEPKDARVLLHEEAPEKIKKKKKTPYQSPKTFFVFDDLSDELRDPSISTLVKVMRHHHTKIILSSQYLKDITPATAQNVDYWMMFGGLSDDYIKRVFELGSPSMNYSEFTKMYHDATKNQFGFLYAGVKTGDYRKGFSEAYNLIK